MNKIYPLLFVATLIGCEEIVYKDVIKYVDRPVPATFVQTSKTEECVSQDTTKVEILMPDVTANGTQSKDTTLAVTTACHMKITIKGKVVMEPILITKDSIVFRDTTIYITKNVPTPVPGPTVYKDTTIYETRIVYETVEYKYLFPGQSVTYIPQPFEIHFQSFRDAANERTKPLPGGDIVLSQVDPNELAGENWTSDSFEMAGFQWVIRISSDLTVEQSKSAIFRELGRMQLKKKYSNDVNKIMSPLFSVTRQITTNDLNILFQ